MIRDRYVTPKSTATILGLLRKGLNVMAVILLLLLVILSYRRPNIPWDSWAYHLPFSAAIFNIGNYSETFILNKVLEDRYHGFPLAAELIQGFFWLATDSIASAALTNSLLITFVILVGTKLVRGNYAGLTFAMLSVPMIAVHATSTYVDLFMAGLISMQFMAAVKIQKDIDLNQPFQQKWWLILYALAAIMAGNSKMWAPIFSAAISFALFLAIYLKYRTTKEKFKLKYFAAGLLVICCLCSGTLIRNTIKFSNPVYPIELNVPVVGIKLPGPEPEYEYYPGYAKQLGIFARPFYFLTSVTQLDWKIRGVDPRYEFIDGIGDEPRKYDPARTGGWWNLLIFLCLGICLLLTIQQRRVKNSQGSSTGFCIGLLIFITAITSFMPQSHELRFFLFIPICLVFTTIYIVEDSKLRTTLSPIVSIVFVFTFIYSTMVLRQETAQKLLKHTSHNDIVQESFDPAIISSAYQNGGVCLGPKFNPYQFRYAAALHGGNYRIEQGWFTCKTFQEHIR